jgi:hypothetical protein
MVADKKPGRLSIGKTPFAATRLPCRAQSSFNL